MELGILNIGYADGYLRGFSNSGAVMVEGVRLPVVGRVSMDLLIIDLTAMPDLEEGDWVTLDYETERASAQSGLSQYELLTRSEEPTSELQSIMRITYAVFCLINPNHKTPLMLLIPHK